MPVHDLQVALAERLTRPLEHAGLASRRRRLLVDAVGRVLDVGAGSGANLPHYRDAESVTALEPEPVLARRLVLQTAEAAVPVEVVEAPIEAAPFDDESFDTVVCTLVLCTVADLDRALRTIHRLLRPDGRLLFLEHIRAPGGWGRLQGALTPIWKTVVPGCHLDRDPLAAMRASGFVVTDCEHFTMPYLHTRMGLAAHGAAPAREAGSGVSPGTRGTLALIGGGEWHDGCRTFDAELLAGSGADEVVVLPTAAAYEYPERAVASAIRYFADLGAKVRGLMVLRRSDADDEQHARTVAEARFVYVGGGSALHLRSVLKETRVWDALVTAWGSGATVAASSAGAMVLGDPMVDPRGGAFTLGLGLIEQVAVVAHHNTWPEERAHRTMQLAPRGVPIVAIDEQTAVIRDRDGTWRSEGVGRAEIYLDGRLADLSVLPG